MTLAVKLIGLIVIFYGLLCLGLRQWQTHLLFFPDDQIDALPDAVGLDYEEVVLAIGDGETQGTVHGVWIPSQVSRIHQDLSSAAASELRISGPTVLYLHGNGSNVGDLTEMGQMFHHLGWNSLLIDYRGYGRSQGPFPNEKRVYKDAAAAWTYLIEERQLQPEHVMVYGHSLGGAIAIELATRYPEMAGVIVEGSFTSMRAMATLQSRYQFLPLDWILTQHFDSLAKVRSLVPPLLLIHGDADETIPYQMSQALQDAAQTSIHQPATTLVLFPEAGHNDLPEVGGERYIQTLRTFAEQVLPATTVGLDGL